VQDGDYVTCSACQQQALVKVFSQKQVSIMGPKAAQSYREQNIALQCQECGAFVCFSCASASSSGSVSVPKCPACGEVGGPYFVIGEKSKPWWQFWK
jgi:hypothetical protein